ncbi:Prolyl oligopeptidase family protein [Rhynchospora pubera]|uniref:Prolyl endopeptidase n=1 Tax=Rhynchospora pubera TaxID=906938 RepID=A0AAV8EIV1_9POAL|nr:Prolyl oligopeptidase family protein [Rhynchospora pubera]
MLFPPHCSHSPSLLLLSPSFPPLFISHKPYFNFKSLFLSSFLRFGIYDDFTNPSRSEEGSPPNGALRRRTRGQLLLAARRLPRRSRSFVAPQGRERVHLACYVRSAVLSFLCFIFLKCLKLCNILLEKHKWFEFSDVKPLVGEIYAEMRARIKEDDISAPVRKGSFYYYVRTLTGKEYSQYCRRFVPTDALPSVEDVMPTGPDAPEEHVILDKNVKAEGHDYYSIGAFEVSPNNKMVAYAEDTKGDEIYLVHVIDAESGKPVEQPLKGITSNVEWANDEYIVYVTMDEILRPDKVWLHKLGTDQSSDTCLYHEKDDMFSVDVTKSASKQYLFVGSESKNTRFVFYLDVSKLENGLLPLTPRVYGIDTTVDHRGDHFFITRRSEQCYNSELVICPVDNVSDFTLLLPHRESVKIQNFRIFKNHIALCEREHGLPEITVYSLPPIGEPIRSLENGRRIEFVDPVYDVGLEESEYNSRILRFSYSSMKTPLTVYDYDMETGASAQKKIQAVLGGFDASNYVTERQWAVALDGTRIPISILYRKNQVKLDGSDPLLLYGYGSYEVCIEADFSRDRLTLVDRGFIYAIAHIRGGGEMGRKWYENGKLTSKKNTFTDFITCAEYLLEKKYGSPQKLCIDGRSAGGLLISSVVNMRPDLFKAAILGVPFVDVVTTMLDPTIPLTTSEWEEWGDPRKEEFYYYMKSYSPVDNVEAKDYPHMLVTAGLNDPRVMYSEPAKYVAKLREMKTNNNLLLFKCELGAGHFSKSGRFERLQEDAFIYAFVLKALDLIPKASL